jgi:capsular polysaccharide biosynthesis protein
MPIEVEAAGQVDEFIRVLRRRIWWIVVPLCVIGSLGTFYAVVVPKKYVSECSVMIKDLGESAGEFGRDTAETEGLVAKEELESRARIKGVLTELGWGEYKVLNDDGATEYVKETILPSLSVNVRSSGRNAARRTVEVSFAHTDQEKAQDLLRELTKNWTDKVLNRAKDQKAQVLEEARKNIAKLDAELDQISTKILEVTTTHAIPPPIRTAQGTVYSQPLAYSERDKAVVGLQELEEEIREAEDQFRLKTAERDSLPVEDSVEYMEDDPLTIELNALDEQISRAELDIESKGWAPGHSERRKAERLIQKLKVKRDSVKTQRDDELSTRQVVRPNSRRVLLTEELRSLAAQIGVSTRRKDELEVRRDELTQQCERLNEAFRIIDEHMEEQSIKRASKEALSAKASELQLEVNTLSSDQGDPFEFTIAPSLPTRPTSPNPWAISLGSIVFGLGLGFGLAILMEYSKNCFRSPRELSRVMPHPVLGTINAIHTRRERARAIVSRVALGGGSAGFVLAVTFVTWAWANDSDRLNGEVVKAIDKFRELLM